MTTPTTLLGEALKMPDLKPNERGWWLCRYVAGKGVLELSEDDRELILKMLENRVAHPQSQEGWKPIESAPKDGTRIMALSDEEIIAETIAAGEDPEAVAEEVREVARKALAALSPGEAAGLQKMQITPEAQPVREVTVEMAGEAYDKSREVGDMFWAEATTQKKQRYVAFAQAILDLVRGKA